jgi:hypothetical protein
MERSRVRPANRGTGKGRSQFGFGVIRAIPATIDSTWNGIVDITNWANKWKSQPPIPDSAKLHLTQSYDKFVGDNFHVDTSSPHYTGGDFVGQVALLFVPIGGEEFGLGDLFRGVLSKLRLPR